MGHGGLWLEYLGDLDVVGEGEGAAGEGGRR